MNEENITEYLVEHIESINDMDTPVFERYKAQFLLDNREIIKKYVPFMKRFSICMRNCFSNSLFTFNGAFYNNSTKFSYTRIRLGQRKVLVPIEFNCIMEAILTKNLNESGLFRKSANISDLERCFSLINDKETRQMYRLEIINRLLPFNIITLTVVYKRLFDNYEMPLIPHSYLKILLNVAKLENKYEQIVILKYVLYMIPKSNRNMVDSITQFFALMRYLVTNYNKKPTHNMDLHGFAVVIMPKIFLKPGTSVSLNDINDLIKITEFLFENRKILFSVGVERIKRNGQYMVDYYDSGIVAKVVHKGETDMDEVEEGDDYDDTTGES
ncbi:putative Rho GTPase-activating protein domain, Rho GTPase activation protein [Trachipleistophora hominis]|uniref:Putative Rho GTPase-activating protein domain, Rho GTPase activation protein n=1 Tax=Trachipleistophora hominis TaxID=72359 RepID=L7JU52_TRAHO|nr:putative Rho GTPase-activating protein domain, Rho GTPase activation protein [Trachipleistophora hominis]